MTDKNKKCDKDCCCNFFDEYNEDEDDYEIQRLQDIITICEFLIKTRKHKKDKKRIFDELMSDQEESDKKTKSNDYTAYVYKYRYPPKDFFKYYPWFTWN